MSQPTVDQAFALALQHHEAGRLQEAEQLYRKVLARHPEHTESTHNLGVLAYHSRRYDVAIDLLRRAIVQRPNYPEAYSNLGNALKELGQLDEAIAAYRLATHLRPEYAEAYYNLGNALSDKGESDAALAAYRRAISLRPDFAQAHNGAGNILRIQGHLDEAYVAHRRALQLQPRYVDACNNLGLDLNDQGKLPEAIDAFRRAIAIQPNYTQAHNNLGNALRDAGRLDEAIAAFHQAISLNPALPEPHHNLGVALQEMGRFAEAIASYRKAIALRPHFAEAHNGLGVSLRSSGTLDDSVAAFHQTLLLNPDYCDALNNLGSALKDKGLLDDAITSWRRAIDINPHFAAAHSNLVYALQFHPDYDAKAIAAEQYVWNQRHAKPLKQFIEVHTNDPDPDRRLRIGYVSPNFKDHCQALFMIPLLRSHDLRCVEVFCYADIPHSDTFTRRLQGYAHTWRNITGRSSQDVAEIVRQERIDIMVDLTMHMGMNRLAVFARKPAPVQVCWLAYPGSTGLGAIDYRFSDPYLDPPGADDSVYSEQTMRLPDTFWCYEPLDCQDIPVSPLPATKSGTITFGCLNNFCKINDTVLSLWAQVLQRVPGSRLLMLAQEGDHRRRTVDHLGQMAIDPARIDFASRLPNRAYMELYHHIDIGLDTFPYNGHTTSLDSLWMGVPVVTLVGQIAVSRAGWCHLSNLGLTELAAKDKEQFVHIAVQLANDLPRLGVLRSTLRHRMEQSPLMGATKFARSIENAYRQIWRSWCATRSKGK